MLVENRCSRRTFFMTPLRATKLRPTDQAHPHVQGTSLRTLLRGPSCLLVFTFILLTPHLSLVPMSLLLTLVIPVPEFTPPAISGLGQGHALTHRASACAPSHSSRLCPSGLSPGVPPCVASMPRDSPSPGVPPQCSASGHAGHGNPGSRAKRTPGTPRPLGATRTLAEAAQSSRWTHPRCLTPAARTAIL
ncbi:uncharacterized protein LOC106698131 isoform X2 [Myotis lucifugus]|uniref:uncharacterized protein LOC106698131 isoform X2 n=1 Tax=Myotis lucifugus TaxID=59463 RepID=UPI000CCC0B40|nr:uncharacterized protein LOC106698131 isoform X2 [Myotis lucifugus]